MKKSNPEIINREPKVTILCQYFYPENVTAASLSYELAQALVKTCEVKVISGMPQEYYDKKYIERNQIVDDIEIERIKYIYKNRKSTVGRFINNASFFLSISRNRRKLKKSDVVITYSSPPINPIIPAFFAKRYGFKLIYVVYDIYPDMALKFGYLKPGSLVVSIFNKVNKYVYSRCDKIIVLSSKMKEYFVKNIGYGEKVVVIPNWYEDNDFHAYIPKGKGLSILYGGNIGVVQDVDTMLEGILSLKDQPSVEFNFAAHGSNVDYLFDEFKANKIKSVKKLGYMPKAKYDKLLDSADIAIISLDKRMLGLASPSKFYSYLAKGKPVIFIGPKEMDVAKEIIDSKIGYVIENGDSEKFRSVVMDLLKDKSRLKSMSARARQLFLDKYTKEICTNEYLSVVNNLMSKK